VFRRYSGGIPWAMKTISNAIYPDAYAISSVVTHRARHVATDGRVTPVKSVFLCIVLPLFI